MLALQAVRCVLVVAHERLKVARRGIDHAEVDVRLLDLRPPQADVLHTGHDAAEQELAERQLRGRAVGEFHALLDIEVKALIHLSRYEPVAH